MLNTKKTNYNYHPSQTNNPNVIVHRDFFLIFSATGNLRIKALPAFTPSSCPAFYAA